MHDRFQDGIWGFAGARETRSLSHRFLFRGIDVAAVEQEIERLEGELTEVRTRMKQYLKELGV